MTEASSATTTTREYYNSDDADHFYHMIWGGEDIHIGLYQRPDEEIADASRRTVEYMAAKTNKLSAKARVLDIGSGYGGAARHLARTRRCSVVGLNLSEVENNRHREKNAEAALEDLIDVVDGSFEQIPFDDGTFDLVWSQDAILHSGNRRRVFDEVARVLKPGGEWLFTDPMQSDDCPDGVLQPILDRIHLESLGSPKVYASLGASCGLENLGFDDLTPHLVHHYSAVLRETEKQQATLAGRISDDYLERMKKGLRHWIDGGGRGYLAWGVLHFRKA